MTRLSRMVDKTNAMRARIIKSPNTPGNAETWLEQLGVGLIDVWGWDTRLQEWFMERHVDDHETFLTTVAMMLARRAIRHAMWDGGAGTWAVIDRKTGDTRSMPSREAAEMLIMLHGR